MLPSSTTSALCKSQPRRLHTASSIIIRRAPAGPPYPGRRRAPAPQAGGHIFDADSEYKSELVDQRLSKLGNESIRTFHFYMQLHGPVGFFHESTIPPGQKIAPHSHNGDILNIVTAGAVTINGKTYEPGAWYLITEGTTYSGEAHATAGAVIAMFCSFKKGVQIMAWVHHDPK